MIHYIKIRNFLLSNRCREFLFFLFFVFISLGFWVLQTLDDIYQAEFNIPLRLKNVPQNVIITSDLQQDVRVRVEDRGTVLTNYMLGRSFLPISFDFRDYESSGPYIYISKEDLAKRIYAQLNPTTKLITILPDSVGYIYSEGICKKVPVVSSGTITAGMQYYIADIKYKPDSVTVYAPFDVLKNITSAYTLPLKFESLTDNTSANVPLKKINGVKFEPSHCDISVEVDVYSEKSVEVPVIGVGFPMGKTLRTFPSKVQVSFQVGLAYYNSISASDFEIKVNYSDLVSSANTKIILTAISFNDKVSHIRVNPSNVDYIIEETLSVIKDD